MSTPGTYRWGAIAWTILFAELILGLFWVGAIWVLDHEVPAFHMERRWILRALLILPALALIFLIDLGWRNRSLRRFADASTLTRMVPGTSSLRVVLRFLLFRHGLSFLVIALAGPQFGTRLEEVRSEGIDLVVAMDVSNSMECEDIRPSRMESARRAMSLLLDRLRGDRLGIVVFAGDAFVQLPITTDRSAAKLFLNTVNTHSVGTQGTAIGAAIELAQQSFDVESPGNKAIIVITDGENHEDDAEGAARAAAQAGIVVHTIGMGTPDGGPIPIRRSGQVIGFKKDGGGNVVVSRLNEAMLKRIAAAGNGAYVRATTGSSGIEQLVADLRSLETSEKGNFMYTAHEDQFQFPLGAGILLIFLSIAIGDRRHWRASWSKATAMAAPLLFLFASCGSPEERIAEKALREGATAYREGRSKEAADAYSKATFDPRAAYGLGNSLYRQQLFDTAVTAYQRSVEGFDRSSGSSAANYNLGNGWAIRAALADSLEKVSASEMESIRIEGDDIALKVRKAVERDSLRQQRKAHFFMTDSALAHSAEAFKNSLRIDPRDEDARHNLALVQRRIAARAKAASDNKSGDSDKDKELTEKAKLIMAKADELVEAHRFSEALKVLQDGLRAEPSLQKEKEYMQKLEVVTKAATAT